MNLAVVIVYFRRATMNLKVISVVFHLVILGFYSSNAQSDSFIIKAGKLFNSETGIFESGKVIFVKGNKVEIVKSEKEVTASDKKQYTWIDLGK